MKRPRFKETRPFQVLSPAYAVCVTMAQSVNSSIMRSHRQTVFFSIRMIQHPCKSICSYICRSASKLETLAVCPSPFGIPANTSMHASPFKSLNKCAHCSCNCVGFGWLFGPPKRTTSMLTPFPLSRKERSPLAISVQVISASCSAPTTIPKAIKLIKPYQNERHRTSSIFCFSQLRSYSKYLISNFDCRTIERKVPVGISFLGVGIITVVAVSPCIVRYLA